ncbi:von Willebrand factor type A domain-containing protein [Mycena belliarum]|uniref:von Willebrand factor type A domain-containing protein n=1 Tax=Mycena belliarum TaxID=1033014 RepID=A0AAD6XM87_9AGAR|nr:von Willebrand factor type A domain-containing protein [Mycena belliae]
MFASTHTNASIRIFGLYYYYQDRVVSLPLLNVRAEAGIKELAAQVKLTQTYGNDASFPIEAKYSFPIPARAAVCSFVMIKQDGTRVVGYVQEKEEARETYNTAVAQGQQASLMEQQTPDVFQVSVGNIPSNEQVQIELVYATELSEDEENDSIRFHLPVHIGARYGQGPQTAPSVFKSTVFISPSSNTPFLSITANVEGIAPISKIGSPSHTVSTELGPDPKLPNYKELPFSNYARISLSSDAALDKDFVLTIKSAGLDAPRCVAELHPVHDTLALALTLVPRFKLPDLSRQEFVFLVDRSGSMGGKRIAAARKALVVMLRALPHQDSLFQITSFGSRFQSIWPNGSKPYNQETLEEATRHVDVMQADFGGTEIRSALKECFEKRKTDRPLSVLMLTDGDAWDLDGVLDEVQSAVASAPKGAHIRVSVLGIGNAVSTAMCEGIARVGNGTCMLVGEEEASFTGKIARMLKAARTPPISSITLDWGRSAFKETQQDSAPPYDDEFEIVEKEKEKGKQSEKTLNIFDESVDDPLEIGNTPAPPAPEIILPPVPTVQQAPFAVRNLSPNIRLNVYAILQGKTVPKSITLRGSTTDGAQIELSIAVTLSHLQNASGAPPAIHALAARKIIQDLEDGKHALASTLANPDDADLLARTVKASIIRLGKTHSISSTHTSFVAVDKSKPSAPVYLVPAASFPDVMLLEGSHAPYAPATAMRKSSSIAPRGRAAPIASESMSSSKIASFSTASAAPQSSGSRYGSVAPQSFSSGAPYGGPPPSNGLIAGFRGGPPKHERAAPAPGGTAFGEGSDLFGSISPPPPPAPAPSQSAKSRSGGSILSAFGGLVDSASRPAFKAAKKKMVSAPAEQHAPSVTTSDPLEALARLQSFDGCFSLNVLDVIKLTSDLQTVRGMFPAGASDNVVATVLVMAFLATKLGAAADRDSWEGLHEKARGFVEAALLRMGASETADGLQAKVTAMLA